jgi:hypothetical protein
MTLRAWIITMRGRIREALVPELQVLREENRLLRADVEEALSVANYWHAIAQEGIKRANVNGPDARRPLTDEEIENCRGQGFSPLGLLAPFDFCKAARAIERAHGITGGDDE